MGERGNISTWMSLSVVFLIFSIIIICCYICMRLSILRCGVCPLKVLVSLKNIFSKHLAVESMTNFLLEIRNYQGLIQLFQIYEFVTINKCHPIFLQQKKTGERKIALGTIFCPILERLRLLSSLQLLSAAIFFVCFISFLFVYCIQTVFMNKASSYLHI